MKESFYFPHDYNAIQDPKMMSVLADCGTAGVGLYWIIIEILHQQLSGTITKDQFRNYIKFYTKFDTNEHLLNNIEDVLICSGLLFEGENGEIGSNRVKRNKEHRKEISEKRSFAGKKSAELRTNSTSVQQKKSNDEQGKERKGNKRKENTEDFDRVWELYPKKDGKKESFKHYKASVITPEDYQDICSALDNYIEKCKKLNPKYIKNGSTWFNNWRDWVDYKEPETEQTKLSHEQEIMRKVGIRC